jgi:hypothetical protein
MLKSGNSVCNKYKEIWKMSWQQQFDKETAAQASEMTKQAW